MFVMCPYYFYAGYILLGRIAKSAVYANLNTIFIWLEKPKVTTYKYLLGAFLLTFFFTMNILLFISGDTNEGNTTVNE